MLDESVHVVPRDGTSGDAVLQCLNVRTWQKGSPGPVREMTSSKMSPR